MILFLINALKIIFLLGFLILIHEGGHFIAAKLSKVTVNEFAIGFGPVIWQSKNTKTKYCLRLIPIGGFVSMEGEVEKSNKEGSFSNTSILKRMFIVVAGGAVNIIFALTVYFVFTSSQGNFIGTTIDSTVQNYSAEKAGILPGDEILKINNKKVTFKSEVTELLQKSNGDEITVTVNRNNEKLDIKLTPTKELKNHTGLYFSESSKTEVISIEKDSSAEKSGIKEKDVILEINGISVEENPYKVLEIVEKIEEDTATILVLRNNEKIEMEIAFDKVPTYLLGANFKIEENTILNRLKYGIFDTKEFIVNIATELKGLFTGKVGVDDMAGIVGISSMVADTKGIGEYIYLLALISLSLGVTNLLPFPPLDGGKFVLLFIEGITKKPIKENVEITLQLIGMSLLIFLTLYITYNDILKIFK